MSLITDETANAIISEGSAAPADPATSGMFTVKVGDEERQVSLQELQDGYMRQADYTRKTQDLSAQRKELEPFIQVSQAFERDPQATTVALARYYGFDPVVQAPKSSTQDSYYDDPYEEPAASDPRDAEIEQLKRQVSVLMTNQSSQTLDREAQALAEKDKYHGLDPVEVKRHAIVNKFPSLESAARDLLFEDRNEAWQSLRDKERSQQEIIEQKRQAGVVAPGSGPASGSLGAPQKDYKNVSFRDTLRETMAELNMTDLSSVLDL